MAVKRCENCGAMIHFKKTRKGKIMPVDIYPVWYVPENKGRINILDEYGDIVRGRLAEPSEPGVKRGYTPHFGSCRGR